MKSSIIHNYFQHVFLISTVDDTGRQKRTMDYLTQLGIKFNLRIAPYNGRMQGTLCDDFFRGWNSEAYLHSGAESLRLCYASIFAECIYNNIDTIMIFEDDVLFEPDWESKFGLFMQNLPNDWEMLNLGYHESKDKSAWAFEPINQHVSLLEAAYTSHWMAVRGLSNMRLLAEKVKTSLLPIDMIFTYFSHVLKCENKKFWRYYTPNEILCRQLSYRSDAGQQPHQIYESLIAP